MIKQPRKGITRKRRYTQTPFEKSRKEKRLKLKNGPIAILKASQIPFPPDTPHQTVRHYPPNNYITMSPEVTRPAIQQVRYPLRHHPTNTKQAKDHTPHLKCNRTVKEEMIYKFPTPFAHKTPLKNNKVPLLKIIYS